MIDPTRNRRSSPVVVSIWHSITRTTFATAHPRCLTRFVFAESLAQPSSIAGVSVDLATAEVTLANNANAPFRLRDALASNRAPLDFVLD